MIEFYNLNCLLIQGDVRNSVVCLVVEHKRDGKLKGANQEKKKIELVSGQK